MLRKRPLGSLTGWLLIGWFHCLGWLWDWFDWLATFFVCGWFGCFFFVCSGLIVFVGLVVWLAGRLIGGFGCSVDWLVWLRYWIGCVILLVSVRLWFGFYWSGGFLLFLIGWYVFACSWVVDWLRGCNWFGWLAGWLVYTVFGHVGWLIDELIWLVWMWIWFVFHVGCLID